MGETKKGTRRFWEGVTGVFQIPSHEREHKAFEHVCVCVLCVLEGGGHWGTSYQENGAKETEPGDRKLEEEAAPIVPAQHCSYGNRQQGGKSAEKVRGRVWQ